MSSRYYHTLLEIRPMVDERRWLLKEGVGPDFKSLKIGYMESQEIKIEMEEGKENGKHTPATGAILFYRLMSNVLCQYYSNLPSSGHITGFVVFAFTLALCFVITYSV